MLSCSVVFLVVGATLARACYVKLDIKPSASTPEDSLDHADTRNKVCAYGVNREGKNVFQCVNGVRGDDEKIEFKYGKNLSKSSPVYLEILGSDELWLDTITTWFDGCNCNREYGRPNDKGWCMSTNPNDDDNFSSSDVPEGECYRTLKLGTDGVVYGMQSSYALSIPGVLDGFQQAQASVARSFGRWGRRLDADVTNGATSSTWAEFESLPEDAWVELPGQQNRRLLENNKPLMTRLAALEEGLQ